MKGDHTNQGNVPERTKLYATQLWGIIKKQIDKQASSSQKKTEKLAPEKFETDHKWFLTLLLLFPYILIIGFIASFFWDFDGLSATIFGYILLFEGLLRILCISGLIGFVTNWLAITMLFRPRTKRPLFGQGVVPAQKERISYRLAKAVADDLINPDIIKKKIQESQVIPKYREQATIYTKNIIDNPDFRTDIKTLALNYVNEMIADAEVRASIAKTVIEQINQAVAENSFEKLALKAYSFLKGQEIQQVVEEALTKLPTGVETGLDKLDDYLDVLPNKIDEHSEAIENMVTSLLYKLINQLDVQNLVEDKLKEYDEQKLEILIKNASNDQLRYIQYLGAVLGTFGGLVIWQPLGSLVVITLLFILLLSVDYALTKIRK